MALHRVIEKHKIVLLGQEITYTNKYIKYTKGTSYGFTPQSGLISYSSQIFKYEFEHPYMTPALYVDSKGDKFIVPGFKKVHPETTLNDIIVIRPAKEKLDPVEKNSWKFESSSEKGLFYTVRQNGTKLTCTCSGMWRAKDKRCKHIKEIEQKLSNDNK